MCELENNFAILLQTFEKACPLLDGEDIAEALWLAQFMGVTSEKTQGRISAFNGKSESETPTVATASLSEEPSRQESYKDDLDTQHSTAVKPEANGTSFYVGTESGSYRMAQPGRVVKLPGVKALPNQRALERALRPLRRTVLSRQMFELDELATVETSAEYGEIIPIIKRKSEAWLELNVVIDAGVSMFIWHETLDELVKMFKKSGIYANVRVWYLFTDDDIRLTTKRQMNASRCSARALFNANKQQCVLVCTDCASIAWFSGEVVDRFLLPWQAKMPVSLIQMLPQRLWMGTALRDSNLVNFSAPTLAASNYRLKSDDWWCADVNEQPEIKLPIISINPFSFAMFSKVLLGQADQWIKGVEFKRCDLSNIVSEETNHLSAEEIVRNFRQQASPQAYKLAGYLSCIELSLSAIELVRHNICPESNKIHLAEFILSGLVKVEYFSKSNMFFEFRQKTVREFLRSLVTLVDYKKIIEVVYYKSEKVDIFSKINNIDLLMKITLKKIRQGEHSKASKVVNKAVEGINEVVSIIKFRKYLLFGYNSCDLVNDFNNINALLSRLSKGKSCNYKKRFNDARLLLFKNYEILSCEI